MCQCYQELKSPKLVLPLDFLAAVPLVDGPLSSSAAERFLREKKQNMNTRRSIYILLLADNSLIFLVTLFFVNSVVHVLVCMLGSYFQAFLLSESKGQPKKGAVGRTFSLCGLKALLSFLLIDSLTDWPVHCENTFVCFNASNGSLETEEMSRFVW